MVSEIFIPITLAALSKMVIGFILKEKASTRWTEKVKINRKINRKKRLFLNNFIIDRLIISYFLNLLYNYHMQIILIILGYLKWHYGQAISALWSTWRNFLYFVSEYFSIKLLFKNFFDSWKRMTDNYPRSFNLKEYLSIFIVNMITRVVGMAMRTFLIVAGLTCYILLALAFPFALITWLFLPFIIITLIGIGIFLIIQ
jgi:hypothetical protein